MDELYGNFDPLTQTWTDGLASKILRGYVQTPEADKRQWVVFDGPVDALWVENMNSVLDDSMVLCLSNGERIKLHPKMRILFEVADLQQASPATVSRCGMVYLDEFVLSYGQLVTSYFDFQNLELKASIREAMKRQVEGMLEHFMPFVLKQKEPIATSNQQITRKLLSFFQTILRPDVVERLNAATEANATKMIHKIVLYCVAWGLGSHLSDESQQKFLTYSSSYLRDGPKTPLFQNYLEISANFPLGEFVQFDQDMPVFQFEKSTSYFELVVPTSSLMCYSFLIEQYIDIKAHIFLTGVSGSGKTVIAESTLRKLQESVLDVKLSFSSQTSS